MSLMSVKENLNVIKRSSASLPGIVLDLFYWVDSNQQWPLFLQAGIDTTKSQMLRDACREALAALLSAASAVSSNTSANARSLLLDEGAPFIDRDTFWIDIQELRSSSRKRVALIDGPPKSGKSPSLIGTAGCGPACPVVWDPWLTNTQSRGPD